MKRRKLPIGIQTFSHIREDNYYYVDKTPLVAKLAESGKYFFLSRPRRFGKSLFLDTLAEAFSGNKGLFDGLYLENNWNWSKKHPVIRISFAEGRLFSENDLAHHIHIELESNANRLNVRLSERSEGVHVRFRQLIENAAKKYGERAVVLVDEYDKPIVDNLTEPEIARSMREGLRNLYSVLKGQDANLRFVFLTGVSKFSNVKITPAGPAYFLKVPNHEVKTALNQALLSVWFPDHASLMEAGLFVYKYLEQSDHKALRLHFQRLFASIPHDWYRNNSIAQYEGYYASVFYSHLAALGLDIVAEDVSHLEQCDLTVRFGNRVYLFEFKVIDGEGPTGEAIQQLLSKDYAAKYKDGKSEVVQIGIEFSRTKRQVVGWNVI